MKTIYCCPECLGINVQLLCWIKPNQDVIETFEVDEASTDILYCFDCEQSSSSFKENKKFTSEELIKMTMLKIKLEKDGE